jgi:protein-S-isoprenylcysteine O-methyltransferase Ste14
MEMNNPLLLGALATASYITRISNRRPNPPPKDKGNPKEDILLAAQFLPAAREWLSIILQVAHIILASQFPPRPSNLCPDPSRLNPKYFTWNPYTMTCIAFIIIPGLIRLSAFKELGKSFTFELAKPAGLVTTGLYAYVQHPSYPTDVVLTTANFALFMNPDGWAGCFLPQSIITLWTTYKAVTYVGLFAIPAFFFSFRIRQEEALLKETFGKEWEVWHAKTARFIPFIY